MLIYELIEISKKRLKTHKVQEHFWNSSSCVYSVLQSQISEIFVLTISNMLLQEET
jgi:hypothetical protein